MSEIKPFTGVGDRVRLAEVVPLDTPYTLNIFASNICNFRCKYCAQSLGTDYLKQEFDCRPENMSLKTAKLVTQQATEFPRKFKLVSIMGQGEPLCNPDLSKIVEMIKKKDISDRIDIVTNASLLTQGLTEDLVSAGLDVLRVSLQGISSESYWKTSQVKIDFDHFLTRLRYFYEHKRNCKVYVKVVDSALEDGEEERFFELFSDISDRMYVEHIKPVYKGVAYTKEEEDLSVDRYGNQIKERFVCAQPFYMMTVWPDGNVYPCSAMYKACLLGNVNNTNLLAMWNSQNRNDFCRLQLQKRRKTDTACKKCCVPNDCMHPEDVLDDDAERLMSLI